MRKTVILLLSFAVCIGFVTAGSVYGQKAKPKNIPVGMFVKVKGNVGVKRIIAEKFMTAEQNMPIYNGDVIKTLKESEAEIVFDNGTGIKIEQKTTFTVEKADKDVKSNKNSIRLKCGFILTDVKKISKLIIVTPTAVAAVRGTLFTVSASTEGKSEIAVFKGTVAVTSPGQPESEAVNVTENKKSGTIGAGVKPSSPEQLDEVLNTYKDKIALKFEAAIDNYREKIDELIKQREAWMDNYMENYNKKIDKIQKRQDDLFEKYK